MPRRVPPPLAALRGLGLGLWLSVCSATAWAQAPTLRVPEPATVMPPSRDDAVTPAQAYDATAVRSRGLARAVGLPQAGGRVTNDLAALPDRVWRPNGRSDGGAGISPLGYLVLPADGRVGADARPALVGGLPAVSMGLRVRVTDQHALFADAYRVRAPVLGAVGEGYGTKLGVEWRPAKSTLGLEHGALGMQLESGYRVSLKVRRGGPSLYLRSQF